MESVVEFSRVLRCKAAAATADTRYSDKINLPPSYLAALLDRRNGSAHREPVGAQRWTRDSAFGSSNDEHGPALGDSDRLPSPLIFRLTQRKAAPLTATEHPGRNAVHCGVREFSCDEGDVAIPEWVMQNAGLCEGDSVAVEFVQVEKGTSAILQALDPAAQSVGNVRALLEAHMRTRLTALFVGETFHVPVGGMEQPLAFAVATLEPMGAVDVVDTDLAVDLLHVDGSAAGGAANGSHGSSSIEELVPGTPRAVKADANHPCTFQLHVPAHVKATDVVLVCRPGSDASLCASRLVRNVGIIDNSWFDYSPPSQQPKRLRIAREQLPSGSNTVYVSVVGFPAACDATIEVLFDAPPPSEQASLSVHTPDSSSGPDEPVCANCGSSVPAARLEMHRAVCERHNAKCPACAHVFKRGSAELERHWHCEQCGAAGEQGDRSKHDYFYHTPHACACDPGHAYASLADVAEHRRTLCPERLIECQYCHTIVAQGPAATTAEAILLGQHAHEWSCGSRSIQCTKCKAYVGIRKVQVHMRVHEMKDAAVRASMVPCANRECGRERGDNPLGLCTSCFGPLYTGQYDPGHHKLLKRLTRNLHAQMTTGCGSAKCRNPHCATGMRKTSGGAGAAPLSQTEAAAMLIPVLRAYAPLATAAPGHASIDYAAIDLHMCV
ncbi:hypothetical protein LPJ61_003802 [Coemansia biformis]|uniref:Ubiquitin-protein ligase E3A N-terminal zinc-binding domain-containing protein n=1 Tax=Coemansia biformis TaxID=1286918 RepID=A0A9W7Y5Y6_9FUNG|nr:hypothetical protein LPJ61_003802 [Coemansia biformis]